MILKNLNRIVLVFEEEKKAGKTMWALKTFGETKIPLTFQKEIEKRTSKISCNYFEMEGCIENIALGEYSQVVFPLFQMLAFFLDIIFSVFDTKECNVFFSLKDVGGAEDLLKRYFDQPYFKKKKVLNYHGGNYYSMKMNADSLSVLRKYLNDI